MAGHVSTTPSFEADIQKPVEQVLGHGNKADWLYPANESVLQKSTAFFFDAWRPAIGLVVYKNNL